MESRKGRRRLDRKLIDSSLPDDVLVQRLEIANHVELTLLAETCNIDNPETMTDENLVVAISASFRYYASSSLIGVFRSKHSFPYKQALIDVADKLSKGFTPLSWTPYKLNDKTTEEEIEDYIWRECELVVRERIRELSKNQREALQEHVLEEITQRGMEERTMQSLSSAGMAWLVGTVVTEMVFVRLILGVGSRALIPVVGVQASTGVGIALAVITLIGSLQDTAYRVTIPASLRLINIRKRAEFEAELEPVKKKNMASCDIYEEMMPYNEAARRQKIFTEENNVTSDVEFDNILKKMDSTPWFSREDHFEDIMKLERTFTCRQLLSLVMLLLFPSSKREAIVKGYHKLSDPEHIETELINPALPDAYEREKVMTDLERIKNK